MALPTSGQITLDQIYEEAVDGGFPIKGASINSGSPISGSGVALSRNEDINLRDLSIWRGWKASSGYSVPDRVHPDSMNEFYGCYTETHINNAFSEEIFNSIDSGAGYDTNLGRHAMAIMKSDRGVIAWHENGLNDLRVRSFIINTSTGEASIAASELLLNGSLTITNDWGPSVCLIDSTDGIFIVAHNVTTGSSGVIHVYLCQVNYSTGVVTQLQYTSITIFGSGPYSTRTGVQLHRTRTKFTSGSTDFWEFITLGPTATVFTVSKNSGGYNLIVEGSDSGIYSSDNGGLQYNCIHSQPVSNSNGDIVQCLWAPDESYYNTPSVPTQWGPSIATIQGTGGASTTPNSACLAGASWNPTTNFPNYKSRWEYYQPASLHGGCWWSGGSYGATIAHYSTTDASAGTYDLRVVVFNKDSGSIGYPPNILATQSITWMSEGTSLVTRKNVQIEWLATSGNRTWFIIVGVEGTEIRAALYVFDLSDSPDSLRQCGDYVVIKSGGFDGDISIKSSPYTYSGFYMVYVAYDGSGTGADGYIIQLKITDKLTSLYCSQT